MSLLFLVFRLLSRALFQLLHILLELNVLLLTLKSPAAGSGSSLRMCRPQEKLQVAKYVRCHINACAELAKATNVSEQQPHQEQHGHRADKVEVVRVSAPHHSS
jgi:hypothetical protein